jgi:hypothetical protein
VQKPTTYEFIIFKIESTLLVLASEIAT